MTDSELIRQAKTKLRSLNISELNKNGFSRNKSKYEFIVIYPPFPMLEQITQEDLFSEKPGQPEPIDFYVHIPFCTGNCTYCCDFVRFANKPKKEVEEYLETLKKELLILKTMPAMKNREISSLYFGGGTPTYLETGQLEELILFVKENLDILPNSEITVETSPETFSKEKAEMLHKVGVNRLSIGVQSFDEELLKICGRRHNQGQAIKAFETARDSGFNNINIDLISGLPKQTPEKFEQDLNIIENLNPESVTVYPLFINEESNLAKMKLKFPGKKENLLLNIIANEKMSSLGYRQFPVHFFARAKENSLQHYVGKWQKMKELLGLGVSCYCYFNDTQYSNHLDIEKYLASVKSGKLPVWKGKKLSKDGQMARFVIFNFKTGAVNRDSFEKRFGIAIESVFPKQLEKLEKLGLIEYSGDLIKLSYSGCLFSEEVCLEFYQKEAKESLKKFRAGYSGRTTNLSKLY